jgi:hypothetical protein
MLSHDLARALLARRNNDVRIVARLDDGGPDYLDVSVPLRDSADEAESLRVSADQVVDYFPTADKVVVFAGEVYTGPRRDDAVAAWLKRWRDQFHSEGITDPRYTVLDDLLDDYREHADTGTSLAETVQGPHPEES